MNRTLFLFVALLFAVGGTLVATSAHAQDEGTFEISPKFKARIAKEKAKQAAMQSSGNLGASGGLGGSDNSPQCGAQNIGNVDTNGRIGTSPREVFVFAPNAINMVSNGCN